LHRPLRHCRQGKQEVTLLTPLLNTTYFKFSIFAFHLYSENYLLSGIIYFSNCVIELPISVMTSINRKIFLFLGGRRNLRRGLQVGAEDA
jgi:hypothetical protein